VILFTDGGASLDATKTTDVAKFGRNLTGLGEGVKKIWLFFKEPLYFSQDVYSIAGHDWNDSRPGRVDDCGALGVA
jgi:hypothetical protein